MKRLLALLLALAAVSTMGISPAGAPRRVKVVSRLFERVTHVPGTLKASQSFRGFSPIDGVLLALLPEGTKVKKGDVVARLDVSDLADKLRDRRINHEIAGCELAIKEAEFALEGYEVANRVAFAEAEVQVAKLAQETIEHGIDYPDYVRHTKSLEANEALRATLTRSLAEMRPHVPRGFVSRDDVDKQETRLKTEEINARVTSLERSIVTSGSPQNERAKAARDVALAEGHLKLARTKLATFEQRRRDGVADLTAKLESLNEEIAAYTAQVERGTLRSPVEGVVIHGYVRSNTGSQKPRVGSRLSRGEMFVEVVQPGLVFLELDLSEADAALVKTKQRVHFTADAFPGRRFEAVVSRVKATVSGGRYERWIFPAVRKLDVQADVIQGDPGLLPEMTVAAGIVVEARPHATQVELAAVSNGEVTRAGGEVAKIKTGRVSGTMVEVLEGLEAGDEVLVPTDPESGPAPDQETVRVAAKDLTLTLADSGALEPVDVQEVYIGELDGEAAITKIAEEGASVKKDEVVAEVDPENATNKLKEKKLELEVAEKDREVAVEQAKSELVNLTQAEKVASLEQEVARIDETIVNLGKKPREIDDLERDLAIQRTDIALVRRKLELKDQLSAKGYVSAEEVKNLRQDLLNRQVNLEVALAKFELAKGGATPVERRKAATAHLKARLNAELARRKVRARETKRDLEVKKAELGIKKAKHQVERYERMIRNLTLRAPMYGAVMRVETWANDGLRKYREGDNVREGTVFAKVASLERFLVRGVVPEDHVQSVKPGQRVRWWLTNFVNEVYTGTVVSVGYVARDRSGRGSFEEAEPRVFDVEFSVDAKSARFQPGVSVKFEIDVGLLEQALTIPLRALHYDATGPYVFMAAGERRRVELGEEEKGEVHVTSGLTAGEGILVPRDDR